MNQAHIPPPPRPDNPTTRRRPSLRPALDQVSQACEAFGAACNWLGEHVLWPLFNALGTAVGALFNALGAALGVGVAIGGLLVYAFSRPTVVEVLE